MDQLLSGLVIRYLVIAVALLHASRGARPRLRVIYGLMEMENENTLECIDGVSNLIQPGATYTFRNPVTGEIEREYTVGEEERSYSFTIQSTNESLVSCTVSSEESDRVMVAAIPQYRADVTAIRQYVYSDREVVEIECPFPLGRLSSLYEFSWERVVGEVGAPITNDTRGVYWLAEEYNRTLHVNISATQDRRFWCVGTVQTCSGTSSCVRRGRDSPVINTLIDQPIVNVSIVPEANSTLGTVVFTCTASWTDNSSVSNFIAEWKVDGMRYGSGRCEQNVTLCNITMSTDNQDITIKLDVNTTFINTPEQSVTVMCAIHFFESDRVERRLPFVDQEVQFNFVCSDLANPQGGNVTYTDKTIGSTATYQCMSPLQLSSNIYMRTCKIGGWTGEAPNCACRNLTEPPGVNVSYSNNQDIGSIATYTCKELPHLMGKRICDATGWNKDEPKCECLTRPEGGELELTDFLFNGSEARYTCANRITGESLSRTRQCHDDGWDPPNPYTCFCRKLPDPIKGTIVYSMNTRVGSVATYRDFKCDIGQEMSGNKTRTCSGNGWVGIPPTCKLTTVTTVSITVLATFTAGITVAVIYFTMTQWRKRKSKRELLYDVPYNYELPPLPPRIKRTDSGIYDTISNGSNDGLQNQPLAHVDNISQCEHRSQDRVVLPSSEVPAASMSPPSGENDNTVNDTVVSQFPPANPEAIISARPVSSSCTQSVEIDLSSERTNGSDLLLNLEVGVTTNEPIVETQNDELRTPKTILNITANVSYQPSTNFDFERNPAYRTNVAIAPEIETHENIAYEHSESNNRASSIGDDESTTDSDRQS